jgi:hypothetical protein
MAIDAGIMDIGQNLGPAPAQDVDTNFSTPDSMQGVAEQRGDTLANDAMFGITEEEMELGPPFDPPNEYPQFEDTPFAIPTQPSQIEPAPIPTNPNPDLIGPPATFRDASLDAYREG